MSKNPKDDLIKSPEELARQREQETIVIPKGQSKVKSLLIWGLMLFVLLIFVIPSAFESSLSGGRDTGGTYLSWKGVDGEPRAFDLSSFYAKKQEFGRLRDIYPFLGMQGMDVNEDGDVARLIVMSDIARGAGVRITDADLADTILGVFGTAENYSSTDPVSTTNGTPKGWVHRQRGLTTKSFEKTLRDVLVVQRFSRFLMLGTGAVDHEELVTRWQADHTEYSFDYVEARTEDFELEVQSELPDTQALNAWLLALPADAQGEFHSPERWSTEFALLPVPVEEGAGALLLAAYPRPEDEESDQKARDYFNSFMVTRFQRPDEAASTDDEASGEDEATEDAEPIADTPFFSFEEVEALCLAEAPLYYSFADWHLAVQQQIASGEAVDLAAECERLGFTLVSVPTTRSLEEWNELDAEWAGENLGNRLRFTQAERFATSLHVHPGGIVASRISERFPPALPDFLEIESEVAAAWIKDAAAIRAKFTLEGVRDRVGNITTGEAFEPKTTPEQFAAAAINSGIHAQKDFTVLHRDFQERSVLPRPGEETPAIEKYLRFNQEIFTLEEGRVFEAKPSRDKESVFLVLVGPTRPADVSKMQPQDLAVQRSQMASDSVLSFFATTFDFENPESKAFLKKHFDYNLATEEEVEGSTGG